MTITTPISRRSLLAGGAALAALGACTRSASAPTVHVYNWSDYIAPDTLKRFEAETGIRPVYDVYDSNEILEAKLNLGRSGYDVVFPSATPNFAREVKAGRFRELDRALIPNAAELDHKILAQLAGVDAGNRHGLPYLMSATGIGFNRKAVEGLIPADRRDSLAMLFDPAIVTRLQKCGVSLLDDAIDVFPAALAFAGRDPKSLSEADLRAAGEIVQRARPHYRYFHSSSYINDLANGEICVAQGWIGDLVQARDRASEAGHGVEIEIVIPREGAPFNIDVMAIPVDAPHPENAHRLINFLLQPDVIGSISNAVGYANAVPAARAHMEAGIASDPAIYPPASTPLYVPPVAPADYERSRNRLWTQIKSGV